ncbi:MAG: pyridoxal-phosphate dependent enzyme [Desulfobacterales bacterium]|nr:pyridoxal-phosphate dependent enzyme [Desulfobacterales bacterium]
MNKTSNQLPKKSLGFFPTPLTELKRFSDHLKGPRIFIKRDDLTGLAFGGNKTRKLEFLIADALSLECDTLITAGAAQSNHCRQTAAAGFIEAIKELQIQVDDLDTKISHIVFPTSSGGTHSGMMIGNSIFAQNKFKLIGIGIDKGEAGDLPLDEHVLNLANSTCEKLNLDVKYTLKDVMIRNEYLGDGYGIVGDLERRAIRLLAETEGILVDPVYTGRALGGMINMIEKKELSLDDIVLFWHTGGSPALFLYSEEITQKCTGESL